MPFEPAKVVVETVGATEWKVIEGFTYRGHTDIFVIEPGMETDFASVPRVFVWFLPRYGRYTLAAILHDHLWRNIAPAGEIRYVDADGIFRRAMRELGVPFWRRWIMWAAVRWGALVKPGGRAGWLATAPKTIGLTLIAAPFVVPAGVLVGVSLVAFQLFELLTWLPLAGARALRRRRGREQRKEVVPPSFEWSA